MKVQSLLNSSLKKKKAHSLFCGSQQQESIYTTLYIPNPIFFFLQSRRIPQATLAIESPVFRNGSHLEYVSDKFQSLHWRGYEMTACCD